MEEEYPNTECGFQVEGKIGFSLMMNPSGMLEERLGCSSGK